MNSKDKPVYWTTTEWEKFNPVLEIRQNGYDTTVDDFKVGDGKTKWKDLPYYLQKASSAMAAKAESQTKTDLATGNLPASPRMRVSRSSGLTLSNSWQRVDFNGTSANNVNSFPYVSGAAGAKTVDWDSAGKVIKFNDTSDKTFGYTFFYTVNGGVRPVNILYRFIIPSPTPFYFPFPDLPDPYARLEDITSIVEVRGKDANTIYSNSSMRQYGLGLELKIGSPTLITALIPPTITNCAFLIYAR